VVERTHAWGNQYGKLRWCTERGRLVVEFWLALANAAIVCGRLVRRAWTPLPLEESTRPTTVTLRPGRRQRVGILESASPLACRSARRLIAASQLRRMAPLAGRISRQ
jgi:hypothetical protein